MDGERAQYLLKESGQFSAVYQKHKFSAVRKRPDGSEVEVQVEILDGGPNAEKRYHVSALTRDGVFARATCTAICKRPLS